MASTKDLMHKFDGRAASVAATFLLTGFLCMLSLVFFFAGNLALFSVCAGALGGLVHELVQSGGKVLAAGMREDGYYLGSGFGLIVGAAAGLMAVQDLLPLHLRADADPVSIGIKAFVAGLALKGLGEAAVSNPGQPEHKPARAGALEPAEPRPDAS